MEGQTFTDLLYLMLRFEPLLDQLSLYLELSDLSFLLLSAHSQIRSFKFQCKQYCSFVFCGLCLWCFAKNTTHQCEAVFLSSRFKSWKLHIFLQLSVVLVVGDFTINCLEVSSPYYNIFEQVSSLLSIFTLARKIKETSPHLPTNPLNQCQALPL